MRLSVFFLLPAVALSFAPPRPASTRPAATATSLNAFTDVMTDLTSKTEAVVGKADGLLLRRVMRVVNHLPAVVTLKAFAEAAGSSKYGVDVAASTFSYSAPSLLSVPTWIGNVWSVVCVAQIASLAKSALASDGDEVDQAGVSALAASNYAAAQVLGSATPLRWLVATSVLSSFGARNNNNNNSGGGDLTVHSASSQLMSGLTTAVAVLGVVAALPTVVPFLGNQPELLAGIGLVAFYGLVSREGNGLVKKVVNAAVVGGILASRVAGGALKLSLDNIISFGTLVTAGTAYVAYEAIMKAKDALAA